MKDRLLHQNQRGAIPLLVLMAVVGVVALFTLSSILPSRDRLLNTFFPKKQAEAAGGFPAGFSQIAVTGNLNNPTNMEFAPDGRLFFNERGGKVRIVKNGSLLPTPFLDIGSKVTTAGAERGLMGIAFDPAFATDSNSRYIYLYYANNSSVKNRVVRYKVSAANPDVADPASEQVLLDTIASDAGNHNGGSLNFGADGKLYITTGDGGSNHASSQDLNSLSGKMLRINKDGTVPSDNPYFGQSGKRSEIWASGLRNPFTSEVDPVSGVHYINDVGEGTWEEIDQLSKGANYGWPTCEATCGNAGFTNPIYQYGRSVGATVSGGAFYRYSGAGAFPSDYQGDYFFSDYSSSFIKRLDQSTKQVTDFASNANNPVDLKIGPDGALYVLSIGNESLTGGSIVKIVNGSAPSAVISANPAQGNPPLTVSFNGSGSTTPAPGTINSYAWDFGDGTNATGVSTSHTYNSNGVFVVTLTVTNSNSIADSKTTSITVGNVQVLGNNQFTGNVDSDQANHIHASLFTMPATGGTVTAMSVHVGNVDSAPNNQFQLAIYADNNGSPGTLVAASSTGTLTANAWNSVPLNASLVANTKYWLGYNNNGSNSSVNNMDYNAGTTNQSLWQSNVAFGTWPSNFGTVSGRVSNVFSIYATYSIGGTPSPSPSTAPNASPTPVIATPASGTLYNAGDTINFSGTGTDPEDGTLPASAFNWSVVFHHDTHTHPFFDTIATGQKSGSFQIPNIGEVSANVWYRIHLTVTDSKGATNEVTRDVMPRKSNLTVTTNPPGLTVKMDDQPKTAPYTVAGVVGFIRQIGVDSPQTLNGITYNFVSWSDNGAMARHDITTPSTNTTYTATFQALAASPSPNKPGDTDNDGDIDIFDYNKILTDFGKKNDPLTTADLDNDNDVDIFDYNILLTNFGK